VYRPFDLANEMEAAGDEKLWIRRPDGTPTIGEVWPGQTYFPDFSTNVARDWWITLIVEFRQILEFDGLWIVKKNTRFLFSLSPQEAPCNRTLFSLGYERARKLGSWGQSSRVRG